LHPAT
jgi:hypothetical protein